MLEEFDFVPGLCRSMRFPARVAWAKLTQVFESVNARIMTVRPANLVGIVADWCHG